MNPYKSLSLVLFLLLVASLACLIQTERQLDAIVTHVNQLQVENVLYAKRANQYARWMTIMSNQQAIFIEEGVEP